MALNRLEHLRLITPMQRINNETSSLDWSFESHFKAFIHRFFKESNRLEDNEWMKQNIVNFSIDIKEKFTNLRKLL